MLLCGLLLWGHPYTSGGAMAGLRCSCCAACCSRRPERCLPCRASRPHRPLPRSIHLPPCLVFLALPLQFFEVDLPKASKKKQQLVKSCLPASVPRPTYVGANLAAVPLDEALRDTAFDPSRKTLFTCEGLIYYLPDVSPASDLVS